MIGNFHAVLNSNQLFFKLTGLSVTNCRLSLIIGLGLQTLGFCPIMPK